MKKECVFLVAFFLYICSFSLHAQNIDDGLCAHCSETDTCGGGATPAQPAPSLCQTISLLP